MSLTYDLTAVKDRDMSDKGWMVTQAVIHHSMSTRITVLTDENASEWYARIHFLEAHLEETMLLAGSDDPAHPSGKYLLTPEDIRRNIGVRTNVGENTTRQQWIRRVVARHNDWAERNKDTQYSDIKRRARKYHYGEVRAYLAKYAESYLDHVEKVSA